MTEQPKDTPLALTTSVAACRVAHQSVCDALNTLATQDDYDTDSETAHAVRWLGQTALALSRYIQANTPDCPPPPRETEPQPNPGPEPLANPEPDPDRDAAQEAADSRPATGGAGDPTVTAPPPNAR